MENHGLLNPRSWSTVRKAQVAGALTGVLITVVTYFAALAAAAHNSKILGIDALIPVNICFCPAGWLIDTLRLPVDFLGGNLFIPGTSGLVCATVLNALLLSAIGTLIGWLCRKFRKPQTV
jgi:hypothetical protein